MFNKDKNALFYYYLKSSQIINLKLSVYCNTCTDTDLLIKIYFTRYILVPNIFDHMIVLYLH